MKALIHVTLGGGGGLFATAAVLSRGRRNFVSCSNAEASEINFGSEYAVPKNETPTGNPCT